MKKIIVVLMLLIGYGATAQSNASQQNINKLAAFKNTDFDFGKIPYAKPVEFNVLIKNIGTDVLTIDNVTVGCGCTTPKYEKGKKIMPGDSTNVTLGFNAGTMGTFMKNATLYFNGGALSKQVNFKGETFQAPVDAAPANGTIEKLKSNK